VIKAVQKSSYPVPHEGLAMLHEEIMWYATEDDRLLGAVIRDKIDNDFGWIIMQRNAQGYFYCIDVECSYVSVTLATEALHARMETTPRPGITCPHCGHRHPPDGVCI